MARYTYAVFLPSQPPRWARTNNKAQALAYARQHGGYVTRMDYASGRGTWDAPTFRGCSELVADFTTSQAPTCFYSVEPYDERYEYELEAPAR